jgi:hypothetical protein
VKFARSIDIPRGALAPAPFSGGRQDHDVRQGSFFQASFCLGAGRLLDPAAGLRAHALRVERHEFKDFVRHVGANWQT